MGRELRLSRCRACGLLVRVPLPSPEELNHRYKEEYWAQYQTEQIKAARQNLYAHVLGWLGNLHPGQGILVDVGCGGGGFLSFCQQAGWKGIGFDPSAQAIAYARERGFEVFEQGWPACSLPDGSADVVTFINVLDHLRDPFGALQEAWRILRLGGLLYIRVPNGPVHIWIQSALGGSGLVRLSVFHLYGFGRRAFLYHLSRLGFAVLGVRTAPPSLHDVYEGSGWWMPLLRTALKKAVILLYLTLNCVGLNRLPWGTSIEVMARKGPFDAR